MTTQVGSQDPRLAPGATGGDAAREATSTGRGTTAADTSKARRPAGVRRRVAGRPSATLDRRHLGAATRAISSAHARNGRKTEIDIGSRLGSTNGVNDLLAEVAGRVSPSGQPRAYADASGLEGAGVDSEYELARVIRLGVGDQRLAAIWFGGRISKRYPDDSLIQALVESLQDSDAAVRRQASEALGDAGSPAGVEPLLHALRVDQQADVRALAARSLGFLAKDSTSEPAIIDALSAALLNQAEDATVSGTRCRGDRLARTAGLTSSHQSALRPSRRCAGLGSLRARRD